MVRDVTKEVDALYRRLHSLVLGGSDMHDVLETARYLRGEHAAAASGHDGGVPWHVRRVLETGMFVTYARPFVEARRGLPRLKRASGLSEELRATHDEILERRNTVYAHTDATPLRRIIELSDPAERSAAVRKEVEYLEEWFPPTRDGLADLEALAIAHLQSVMAEIDEVRARIVTLEESPRPT